MRVSTPSRVPLITGQIDFGWIGKAWALFSAQSGVWVGATALFLIVNAALWALFILPFGGLTSLRRDISAALAHLPPPAAANPYLEFAQAEARGLLLGGILAVFNGGLYRMALRQSRGEAISVIGLFSAFPRAMPLATAGIVVPSVLFALDGAGLWLLHWWRSPSAAISIINAYAWPPALVLPGLVMFVPLFIVDTDMSVIEAILAGARLLQGRWLTGIGFYLVVTLLSDLGAVFCGVGLLATLPLSFLSIAVGYTVLTQAAAENPAPFDPAPAGIRPPPPRI